MSRDKNKIAKLRTKLREAEERGFKTACDLMHEFVESRIEAEVTHRPDTNIYKRTLRETWTQMRNKINEFNLVIKDYAAS